MTRAPAISSALRMHGLHAAAREVDQAKDAAGEVVALRLALATVDGAQHVLRCYARSLRDTRAPVERARLRELEDKLVLHLGGLLRRMNTADAMARVVQAERP